MSTYPKPYPGATAQGLLVFLEVLLIAQYTFQIPTRLQCPIISLDLRARAEALGLHGNAARCLPLFALYLATLMHTYSLLSWKVCPPLPPSPTSAA